MTNKELEEKVKDLEKKVKDLEKKMKDILRFDDINELKQNLNFNDFIFTNDSSSQKEDESDKKETKGSEYDTHTFFSNMNKNEDLEYNKIFRGYSTRQEKDKILGKYDDYDKYIKAFTDTTYLYILNALIMDHLNFKIDLITYEDDCIIVMGFNTFCINKVFHVGKFYYDQNSPYKSLAYAAIEGNYQLQHSLTKICEISDINVMINTFKSYLMKAIDMYEKELELMDEQGEIEDEVEDSDNYDLCLDIADSLVNSFNIAFYDTPYRLKFEQFSNLSNDTILYFKLHHEVLYPRVECVSIDKFNYEWLKHYCSKMASAMYKDKFSSHNEDILEAALIDMVSNLHTRFIETESIYDIIKRIEGDKEE